MPNIDTNDSEYDAFYIATKYNEIDREEQLYHWRIVKAAIICLETHAKIHQLVKYSKKPKFDHYFNYTVISHFHRFNRNKAAMQIVREGLKSKDMLVFTNMRMIIAEASKYSKNPTVIRQLAQSGTLGVLRAIHGYTEDSRSKKQGHKNTDQLKLNLFDEAVKEEKEVVREYKFSSYAYFWIRHYVKQASQENLTKVKVQDSQEAYLVPYDSTDSRAGNEGNYNAYRTKLKWLYSNYPDEIAVLDSSDMELALDRHISIDEAKLLKEKVSESLRTFMIA